MLPWHLGTSGFCCWLIEFLHENCEEKGDGFHLLLLQLANQVPKRYIEFLLQQEQAPHSDSSKHEILTWLMHHICSEFGFNVSLSMCSASAPFCMKDMWQESISIPPPLVLHTLGNLEGRGSCCYCLDKAEPLCVCLIVEVSRWGS